MGANDIQALTIVMDSSIPLVYNMICSDRNSRGGGEERGARGEGQK